MVSALAAHPVTPAHFISGARDGKVSLWDVRCSNKLQWRFWAHTGKLSSLTYSESGWKLLSSGREGTIRLWDYRRLPRSEERIEDYWQEYAEHVAFGHWVPADFLHREEYVVTGSESNQVFIYETCSGKLVKTVALGNSKVIFTVPVPDSVAFYYINLSTQTLGLCDVCGENPQPQVQTPLQIHQHFLREKMHEVMLDYSDLIISELNRLGVLEQTGLHQIIGTLSQSTEQSSREVVALLMRKYEERVASNQSELSGRIMSSTTLPSSIFQHSPSPVPVKVPAHSSAAPRVEVERSCQSSPGMLVQGQNMASGRLVDREMCLCQYCGLDVEMGDR